MKASLDEAWCAWHERWEIRFGCPYCNEVFPACYCRAHLESACVGYDVVRGEAPQGFRMSPGIAAGGTE